MTVQEFKIKYPHLAHLEGDELWDAMAESMLVPYVPKEGDDEIVETKEIGGYTFDVTNGAKDQWDRMFSGEKTGHLEMFALMMPLDIERHPDRTAMTGFTDMEEKERCRQYLESVISDEDWQRLPGAEKEKMISEWRQQKK